MSTILLIGTGRMAYHLGHAIRKAGHTITGITGRDPAKLSDMARFLDAQPLRWDHTRPTADITVSATSDDATLGCFIVHPYAPAIFYATISLVPPQINCLRRSNFRS